jgi:hypothetical protein
MSMDERIASRLRGLTSAVHPDVEAALEQTLRRGRKERIRAALGTAATGVIVLAGVAVGVFALLRLAPLGDSSPTAVITVSPGPASPPKQACVPIVLPPGVPEVPRFCGVSPPTRRVEQGTAYQLRTGSGEGAWLVVGDDVGITELIEMPSELVVVDGQYKPGVSVFFETASAVEAVGRLCGCGREGLTRIRRDVLPDGSTYERWAVPSIEWYADSVERDGWTMAVLPSGPDLLAAAERVARAASWTVGPEGIPALASRDPSVAFARDWSTADLHMRGALGAVQVGVSPGCALSENEPDIGLEDVRTRLLYRDVAEVSPPIGTALWCSNGYVVDVTGTGLDRQEAELLYEHLVAVESLHG